MAALVLVALAPVTIRAQEQVHSEFDLMGWLDLGRVSLASDHFGSQNLRLLLDGSPSTSVTTQSTGGVLVTIAFARPQYVRKVAIRPGDASSYAVRLSIVPQSGERRVFGEIHVATATEAMFRPIDERVTAVELFIESLEIDAQVTLADLRIGGEMHIRSLELENVPETLPEGGSFVPRVYGTDSLGGRPDLSMFAILRTKRAHALEQTSSGRYTARVTGPIDVVPQMGDLGGEITSFLVHPLVAAPPKPVILPGHSAVQLHVDAAPPLRVFRRGQGERSAVPLGITFGTTYYDEDVEPGTAYNYSVARVDRFGNAVSKISEEERVRTRTRPTYGMHEVGRCPVLVALYVDSFAADGEIDRIVASIEEARAFLYRHGMGKPVLDVSYLAVAGPTPSTEGPSMAGIEADLRDLGVRSNDFAIVYAVSNELSGSHGNFLLFGSAGGAMGRGPGVATPEDALGPDPDVAWAFVHEIRHVLASRVGPAAGTNDLASGDFARDFRFGPLGMAHDRPLDLGEAWDGQAGLAALSDWWDQAPRPWRLPFDIIDSDDDGLADADPRLPFDEERFGSSALSADTDGDGLDDLQEAAAGLYAGSDPEQSDTDGDGLLDGVDPWPLSDFTGVIPYGTEPVALASGPRSDKPDILLAACWTEESLVLEVTTPYAADVFVDLDGSGHLGRWESDTDTGTAGAPGSDVWCGPARLSLRAHQLPTGVFVGSRRVDQAAVVATDRPGSVRLTAVLPVALGAGATDVTHVPGAVLPVTPEDEAADGTDEPSADLEPDATDEADEPDSPRTLGLRLEAGRVLGLAITVRPSRPDEKAPFQAHVTGSPWVSLFETHRLLDAVLEAPGG